MVGVVAVPSLFRSRRRRTASANPPAYTKPRHSTHPAPPRPEERAAVATPAPAAQLLLFSSITRWFRTLALAVPHSSAS